VKTYNVVFAPEAEEQLIELYRYIEENASAEIALRYTGAVVERCENLATLPERGTPRDDIRPGLRTTTYKRRTVIAYIVETDQVSVIGLFHGGQDYESELQPESDADSSSDRRS
jgi:plasmid stabilization system protein ParE